MGKQRKGRSERNPIGYITEGKIQDIAINLTDRDYEILKILNRFRYVSSEQLYNLIPSKGRNKAFNELSTGMTRLNRRLRMMFDNYIINKESPRLPYGEGTSVQYCWLDRGGEFLINNNINKRVPKKLPQDYLHYSAITDMFIYFNEINKSIDNKPIRYFRNETSLETINIIPDIIIVNNKKQTYFIEIDRCYKKENIEIDKIKKYLNWKISYLWVKEEWCKFSNNKQFPKIVYAIDDTRKYWKSRVKRMEKNIQNFSIEIKFIPLTQIYNNKEIFIN